MNKQKFTVRGKTALLTDFQIRVLKACSKIPRGKTKTYSQIAQSAGRPNSARAAGNALAMNPFAPHVPCHRVVRSDGKIGGYSARGGKKQKEKLLKMEKAM